MKDTNTTTNELQFIPITEEVMQANKKEFITLLNSTGRTGVKKLIAHLDKNGFFEAPATPDGKLSCKGGLTQHALKLTEYARGENQSVKNLTDVNCNDLKVLFTGLLCLVGKMGQYGKPLYTENVLAGGKQSSSKPYIANPDLLPKDVGSRSVQIISQFVPLEEDEAFAIQYVCGMTGDGNKAKDTDGLALLLQSLLKNADYMCTHFVETSNAVVVKPNI